MAGMMGRRRARPRLSPSAISATCWAAMAGLHELNVEKTAPARAVERLGLCGGGFEVVRAFGRVSIERRVVGFVVGGGSLGGLVVVVKLGLSMAIVVAMVVAIGVWVFLFVCLFCF